MEHITIENLREDMTGVARNIVMSCQELDLHTPYTYWVLAKYYHDTCFIMKADNQTAGLITGINNDGIGFVWQIGILEEYRRKGYSYYLIDRQFRQFKSLGVQRVELTIEEGNKASLAAFQGYCSKYHFSMLQDEIISINAKDLVQNEVLYHIILHD